MEMGYDEREGECIIQKRISNTIHIVFSCCCCCCLCSIFHFWLSSDTMLAVCCQFQCLWRIDFRWFVFHIHFVLVRFVFDKILAFLWILFCVVLFYRVCVSFSFLLQGALWKSQVQTSIHMFFHFIPFHLMLHVHTDGVLHSLCSTFLCALSFSFAFP